MGEEGGDEVGAVGLIVGGEDVVAEVEVALVAGRAIEPDHGLEDAGGGEAEVGAGGDDIFPAGAKAREEEICGLAGGGEGFVIAEDLPVAEEAEEAVLGDPHVPVVGALDRDDVAMGGGVGAEIAVGLLGGDEGRGDGAAAGGEAGVASEGVGEGGCVEPLADILAGPTVAPVAVAIAEGSEEDVGVLGEEAVD